MRCSSTRLNASTSSTSCGQRILVYSAEPASRSQEALDLLASWATTPAVAGVPEP